MIYLDYFDFPSIHSENRALAWEKRTCFDTFYPFGVIAREDKTELEFDNITILYGSNGSGKSTMLNVMAHKLNMKRNTLINRTNFMDDYVNLCSCECKSNPFASYKIITSDDVFNYLFDVRSINEGIHYERENLFGEYSETMEMLYKEGYQLKSLDEFEKLKRINEIRSKTQSKFVRNHLVKNIRENSNGESALIYFFNEIKENGLYLLDEPENSLSAEKQLVLIKYIEESARFFKCQFVIATHSPLILGIKGAKIYNLDSDEVKVDKLGNLKNIRIMYDFFKKNQHLFEEM